MMNIEQNAISGIQSIPKRANRDIYKSIAEIAIKIEKYELV